MQLPESSVEAIRHSVATLASCNESELEQRARRAWEHARARHTRANYAREYHDLVMKLLELSVCDEEPPSGRV